MSEVEYLSYRALMEMAVTDEGRNDKVVRRLAQNALAARKEARALNERVKELEGSLTHTKEELDRALRRIQLREEQGLNDAGVTLVWAQAPEDAAARVVCRWLHWCYPGLYHWAVLRRWPIPEDVLEVMER